ncbi:MAG: TIGR03013 family PEP-CTERM/XrtA system glycosyltransferase [Acetobacteraceae bacterium]|nr:TIGR03013 family PEP-CTERM/XrtA system glycosyltransferase [Acetobacteraceae bacterium]
MARSFGRYLSLEMVILCLIELILSFMLIYAMLVAAAMPEEARFGGSVFFWVRPESANLAAMLAFAIGATSVTIGLYRPTMYLQRRRFLIYAAVATLLAFPVTLAVSETLKIQLSHSYLLWVAKVLLSWAGCILISRWVFALAVRHKVFVRTVLVLGRGPRADRLTGVIRRQQGRLFELAGQLDPAQLCGLGPLSHQKIWGLVIAAGRMERLPIEQLLACKLRGVQVLEDVSFWERHLGRIDLANADPNWLLFADGFSSGPVADAVRRAVDIAISLLFLIFTLPLMVVVGLSIKFDSPGPIFYRQERIGLHGRVFTLMKFRSMCTDAEAGGTPRWASHNDPRVTRVGAFIRSTRIDELPQLLNVLRGEMSFIGPRPERPLFVEELRRVIPLYSDRTWVKPGITGWAQVNFPYGASVEDAREKLSYDLYYVKNRSLLLDLLILISTIRVILFREGAR